ncbi:MAG TPA: nickel pincer cofactor biosynthesis protein LarC [Planctomycetota bacterium]|nr:nickel pincer cofactor biosynthesis protein LarC [Planctomycetota bacterium]
MTRDIPSKSQEPRAKSQELTLFLDPFSGIAGDMLIGALLDLGLDLAKLHHELSKLNLRGYKLSSKRVMRGAISSIKFDVEIDGVLQKEFDAPAEVGGGSHDHGHSHGHEHGHSHSHSGGPGSGTSVVQRSFSEIKKLIQTSALSERVKTDSLRVFTRLAEAEARVHNMDIESAQFHEVGALDSIIDIVGACVGIEAIGVSRVWCAPVALGSGFVKCEHGLLPVPAPATLEIMKGIPTRPSPVQKELTTPTGAALAAALSSGFGPLPSMRMMKVGYGAGSRDGQAVPNVLRAILGVLDEPIPGAEADTILEISANIDDSTPEVIGHTCEKLLAAGALDVFLTPIQMKKFRPGTRLTVLAEPPLLDKVAETLFRESSTFGLRYTEQSRLKLSRRIESVQTPFGQIRVKIGIWRGEVVSRHPEFEDCRATAESRNVPLQEVIAAARQASASIQK